MSWIRTIPKPVKMCIENPDFPLRDVFTGYDWKMSGGTKQLGVLSAAFILANNVDTVIEVGCWQGFSSAILAKALACNSRHGLLITVDVSHTAIKKSKKATQGIPITHTHVMIDSMLVDYRSLLEGRQVGLSFIDGNHAYEYAKHDLNACYEVMKDYGIIALHDYSKTGFPGVYTAANEFAKEKGCPLIYLDENRESTDYRSAILQKTGNY